MTKNNFPVIQILIIFSYWIFCSGKDTITKKDLAGKPVQDGTACIIPFYLLLTDVGKSKPPQPLPVYWPNISSSSTHPRNLIIDKSKNRKDIFQFQKRGVLVCLYYFKGHYHLSLYKWTCKPVRPGPSTPSGTQTKDQSNAYKLLVGKRLRLWRRLLATQNSVAV